MIVHANECTMYVHSGSIKSEVRSSDEKLAASDRDRGCALLFRESRKIESATRCSTVALYEFAMLMYPKNSSVATQSIPLDILG